MENVTLTEWIAISLLSYLLIPLHLRVCTLAQLLRSTMYDLGKLTCTLISCLGDVESTEPTKMLMRIAEHVDTSSPELRSWFVEHNDDVLAMLQEENDKAKGTKKAQDLNTRYVVFASAWPFCTCQHFFVCCFTVYSQKVWDAESLLQEKQKVAVIQRSITNSVILSIWRNLPSYILCSTFWRSTDFGASMSWNWRRKHFMMTQVSIMCKKDICTGIITVSTGVPDAILMINYSW